MRRWDLNALPPSTEKESPRAPGADAPRVPSAERRIPQVLFTSPECRAVVVDLRAGEAMGEHQVRERAVVQVVAGQVSIEARDETATCDAGTLVTFEPSETHSVRAVSDARLLLLLAPWPAPGHYADREVGHTQHLPSNAVADPAD
ncbi:MAG TPA: AraC family ligand binding domain-containing protein [Gaiellaceae bacterium]|nr:AraC family ligand binding domain-containing protein [Gaiellaceae bacterium]